MSDGKIMPDVLKALWHDRIAGADSFVFEEADLFHMHCRRVDCNSCVLKAVAPRICNRFERVRHIV